MLVKLVGGACIVLSGCLLADVYAKAEQKRVKTLQALEAFADYADKKITTVRMPPGDVFASFPEHECLRPLLAEGGDTGGLSGDEAQTFRTFFQALGSGGWEEERRRCRAYLDTVRAACESASFDLPQRKKRYLLLGAAAGAGVALLLW